MLNLKQFKHYLDILNQYQNYEDKLSSLGINIWEREEISSIITGYIELISLGLNLNVENRDPITHYANDFDYWFYELEQGNRVSDYFDEFEKEYEGLGPNIEKVYNFLISN